MMTNLIPTSFFGLSLKLLGAHHVDFRFSTKDDPIWLQDVRKKEIWIISRWLQQYYQDTKSLSDP